MIETKCHPKWIPRKSTDSVLFFTLMHFISHTCYKLTDDLSHGVLHLIPTLTGWKRTYQTQKHFAFAILMAFKKNNIHTYFSRQLREKHVSLSTCHSVGKILILWIPHLNFFWDKYSLLEYLVTLMKGVLIQKMHLMNGWEGKIESGKGERMWELPGGGEGEVLQRKVRSPPTSLWQF